MFPNLMTSSRLGLANDIRPVTTNLLGPENRCSNAQHIGTSGGQGI